MLKIVNGNILNAKEKFICHQVNCKGKMNSGVAKGIRDKWSVVYEYYIDKCSKATESILGDIQSVKVDVDKYVINLFGQENYGYDGIRYTNYRGLIKALLQVLEVASGDIAIPWGIGCVRGGGDWDFIYDLLLMLSNDFKYDIVLYKLI